MQIIFNRLNKHQILINIMKIILFFYLNVRHFTLIYFVSFCDKKEFRILKIRKLWRLKAFKIIHTLEFLASGEERDFEQDLAMFTEEDNC
jgi:hypothetical protein